MSAREGAFGWAMDVVNERRRQEEGQIGDERRRRVSMVDELVVVVKVSILGDRA